jgi:hypothetical protein
MGHFEDEIQKRFDLARRVGEAKYKLLDIAIQGLTVLKNEGDKIATLTLEEMAKSIPEDLELDVLNHITDTLGADNKK